MWLDDVVHQRPSLRSRLHLNFSRHRTTLIGGAETEKKLIRSSEYYFARGDIVIEVEDTLFRVHRDIISAHSTFFHDMFHTPSTGSDEGESDDCPLKLAKDLCSVETFTILCNLLYPKKVGVLPPILVGELDTWAPVLEATQALQMDGTQEYILAKFEEDRLNIPSVAARLLGLIVNYERVPEDLILHCIHSLVIRRGPILSLEARRNSHVQG
ncbi:hypothetical protein OPQ81_001180 [Rhizoctonia solani]|nr:hypothetical protein OPQ81_001180 [Rhizoctonia solani]